MPSKIKKHNALWPALLSAFLLCAALSLHPAYAATLTVTNTNDSGPGSLRQLVDGAAGGDTIEFSPSLADSTITLTSGQISINSDMTIQGLGASLLTIDGNASSRIFYISYGRTVTISGLTITNGLALNGGGIYNEGSLTLEGCDLTGNAAEAGAAGADGDPGADGVHGGEGGAIYTISSTTLNMNHCTLIGNSAGDGGQGGNGLTTGSGGSGGDGGDAGGVYAGSGAMITAINCTFSENTAGRGGDGGNGVSGKTDGNGGNGGFGGAFCNSSASLLLTNCTLTDNRAGDGGSGGSLGGTITGVTGNGGNGGDGGAVYNDGPSSTEAHWSTIGRNTAGTAGTAGSGAAGQPGNGGGLFSLGGAVLGSSILANNSAGGSGPDCSGGIESADYNLILSTAGCTVTSQTANCLFGVDPLLAYEVYDNGGPTPTMALSDGSPAIDAGNPTGAPSEDQRGVIRPQDGNGDSTKISDIGAFERTGFKLTVEKTGDGTGTVTSTPAGIDCGTDCSEAFSFLQQVQLTATPDEGSIFLGWSGDCSGTTDTTMVTVRGDLNCQAEFGIDPDAPVSQSHTVTLPPGSTSTAFRILSAPMAIDMEALRGQIGEYNAADVRIGSWNPSTQAYEEYPFTGELHPGSSAWFLFRNGKQLTLSGQETQVTHGEYGEGVYLPLYPGWNQIGNPYLSLMDLALVWVIDEDWSMSELISADNTITQSVFWVYGPQGYSHGAILDVAQGGWVKKLTPGVGQIFFPASHAVGPDRDMPVQTVRDGLERPPAPPSGLDQPQTGGGGGGGCFVDSAAR